MKSYDIYSIGSALVDLQFTVPFSMLETLSAEKGGTHLIDEAMEHTLPSLLKNQMPKKFCGGTGANTLAALHSMGVPAAEAKHLRQPGKSHLA
jgi:sugar/nucleoside kinase (ribokinase family)